MVTAEDRDNTKYKQTHVNQTQSFWNQLVHDEALSKKE